MVAVPLSVLPLFSVSHDTAHSALAVGAVWGFNKHTIISSQ